MDDDAAVSRRLDAWALRAGDWVGQTLEALLPRSCACCGVTQTGVRWPPASEVVAIREVGALTWDWKPCRASRAGWS